MNINLENLGPCKKKVHIVCDAQEVDNALNDAAKGLQQYVALPGFRKGKAPIELIRRSFEKDVVKAAKDDLMNKAFSQCEKENNVAFTYRLNYEELKFDPKEGYEFVAVVETEPQFELPNYKGLPIKREVADVTEKDVDDAINKLRENEAKYNTVDRPAAPEDIVVINYTGYCDGKLISDIVPDAGRLTKGESQWIRVRKDYFLPGFGEQFVGAKKGDKLQITVEFPANFIFKELSLKKGVFDVEVLEVKEVVLPALDDKFAKSLGAEDLNHLREGVRFDLKKELNNRIRQSLRAQVVEELMARVNFELPETELNNETKEVVYEIVQEQQSRGLTREEIEKYKDEIFNVALSKARNRVKSRYIFKKIAEKEGVTVTDEELLRELTIAARMQNEDPRKYAERAVKSGQMYRFRDFIMAQKVIDLLVEFAKIEDVLPEQKPA